MKKSVVLLLIFALTAGIHSCKKKEETGPNILGGETDIALTKVGNESSIYIDLGGSSQVQGTVTVKSNKGGVCEYDIILDLTGNPDSALYRAIIPAELFDNQGRINTQIKYKFTSEGIQDYYWGGGQNPWTIVKYNDGVGVEYPFNTSDGQNLKRVVTEKTGQDDFPYGFYYIKTTKVEQAFPATDEYVEKMTYRANHKFGLVYVEAKLKTGQTVKATIFPWFLL